MDQNLINLGAAAVISFLILDRFIDFANIVQKKNGNGNAKKPTCNFDEEHCQMLERMSIQTAQMHRRIEVTQDLQRVLSAIDTTLAGNTQILKDVANLLEKLTRRQDGTEPD